jgi:Protein of unknown function (DUF3551)
MLKLALTILAIAAGSLAVPAVAQTFDARYPVCMHVYGDPTYYECRYMTMAACMATASGRSAQCVANPYMASAAVPAGPGRRYRRAY